MNDHRVSHIIMKSQLYTLVIDTVTNLCYQNCLGYLTPNSTVLDVGIGNGLMLKRHHDLIKHKRLNIIGIDINRAYLDYCNVFIKTYRLEDHIKTYNQPIESYEPPAKSFFDYILFSMSFMLFEDQPLVLDRVRDWLKPHGQIIFFQTMLRERLRWMEFLKPKLKYLTTIDFGRVTYEQDFFALLDETKLNITEDRLIRKEWFKGECRMIVSSLENGKRHGIIPERRRP